ncbi:MAG: TetR/AcrR family transcriptional regulator [Actinomycetes bacterium]
MSCQPVLRADAERNRLALVAAAREVFGERGLDAPLDEIARRAGVGNATLYRRFPSRHDLVAAVFADTLRDVLTVMHRSLDDPDPWSGFRDYVSFVCGLQSADRGLADLLTTRLTGAPELEELRAQAYVGFVRLVARAKAAGALRADYAPQDLVLLLMANAGLVRRTADHASSASPRFVSLALDGLRADAATVAAASPGEPAVVAAMTALGQSFGCGAQARAADIAL